MKLDDIATRIDGIPWMKRHQAERMTTVILEHRPRAILELGFKHGVSTCYMAGALQELGMGGHVDTVDLRSARALKPNADELLASLGLSEFVTVYYEDTSYTWRLLEMLERDERPQFDLCYLDGAHNWDTDGFAFFLLDKLLADEAILILDDIDWSYARSPTLQDEAWVINMPRTQYRARQVRKVFELLVSEHPSYVDCRIENGWGFARKRSTGTTTPTRPEIVREVVRERYPVGLGAALLNVAGKLKTAVSRPCTPAVIASPDRKVHR